MSKLADRLQQALRVTPQPLGFRGSSTSSASTSPTVVLIASVSAEDAAAVAAGKEHADSVLLDKADSQTTNTLGEAIWGTRLAESTQKLVDQLKRTGCDFVVLDPAASPLDLLREDDLGKIVEVDPALGDGLIRAADRLPVDAVLVGGDSGLSIHRLMVCQHIGRLVRKPIMIQVPISITKEALEELRDAGVAAVVAPVDASGAKGLERLKQVIDSLPPPSRKRPERVEATLPYPGPAPQVEEEEDFE